MSDVRLSVANNIYGEPVTITMTRQELMVLEEVIAQGVHSMNARVKSGLPPFENTAMPEDVQADICIQGARIGMKIIQRSNSEGKAAAAAINLAFEE